MPTMKSLKDAAEITGLSYKFLRDLCLQKKVIFVRSGAKYYINMEKLAEYLNQGDPERN